MRLIDAEPLRKILEEDKAFGGTKIDEYDKGYDTGLQSAIEQIDQAPTVITCEVCKNKGNERECVDCHDYSCFVQYEPRPHGKWEQITLKGHLTGKAYKCNVCGRIMSQRENFCPSCGMRGDLDD